MSEVLFYEWSAPCDYCFQVFHGRDLDVVTVRKEDGEVIAYDYICQGCLEERLKEDE